MSQALPPIVAPDLDVLFVGINPGLRSAEVGHNFARPGNRFWGALHASGFTPRLLKPEEDVTLPEYGLGITNIAARPTRAASELSPEELREGAAALERLVAELQPRLVAIVGVTAYRTAFGRRNAQARPAAGHDRRPPGLDPPEHERPQRAPHARGLRAAVRRGAGLHEAVPE